MKNERQMVVVAADSVPVIPQMPVIENGFHCPDCRFKMRVYVSKPLVGAVFRTRICDRCGFRQPTEEKAI